MSLSLGACVIPPLVRTPGEAASAAMPQEPRVSSSACPPRHKPRGGPGGAQPVLGSGGIHLTSKIPSLSSLSVTLREIPRPRTGPRAADLPRRRSTRLRPIIPPAAARRPGVHPPFLPRRLVGLHLLQEGLPARPPPPSSCSVRAEPGSLLRSCLDPFSGTASPLVTRVAALRPEGAGRGTTTPRRPPARTTLRGRRRASRGPSS